MSHVATTDPEEKRRPPKKKPGMGTGPRVIRGTILDVRNASQNYGFTEKQFRGGVARGVIPHRRYGGRIIFLKEELDRFFLALPGVTLDQARENRAMRYEGGHDDEC